MLRPLELLPCSATRHRLSNDVLEVELCIQLLATFVVAFPWELTDVVIRELTCERLGICRELVSGIVEDVVR
ncbi:hypothetical protein D3C86_2125450 [compost metagenome]